MKKIKEKLKKEIFKSPKKKVVKIKNKLKIKFDSL